MDEPVRPIEPHIDHDAVDREVEHGRRKIELSLDGGSWRTTAEVAVPLQHPAWERREPREAEKVDQADTYGLKPL